MASWTGRRAANSVRKKAAGLMKEVFERGYVPKDGGRPKSKRPSWALLMTCKDGSESVLFRSKVHDWPEKGKVIQAAVGKSNVVKTVSHRGFYCLCVSLACTVRCLATSLCLGSGEMAAVYAFSSQHAVS